MSSRWSGSPEFVSQTQGSWLLVQACARGRDEANDGDAEVAGLTWRRGCLAGDVVWEVVAGVTDADVALVLERKRGGYQEMRANVVNTKKQTERSGGLTLAGVGKIRRRLRGLR